MKLLFDTIHMQFLALPNLSLKILTIIFQDYIT